MRLILFAAFAVLIVCNACGCASTVATGHEQKYVFNSSTPPANVYDGPNELTPRESALATYAGKMKAEIETYNRFAIKSNYEAGYYVNPDQMAFAGITKKVGRGYRRQ